MSDTLDATIIVHPSPTPTEGELRAWESLPREEQVRLLRQALAHPDCANATDATMSDILAEARARVDGRGGG